MKHQQRKEDILFSICVFFGAFAINLLIRKLFTTQTLVPMIFVFGVFLISLKTHGYCYGIVSAVLSVFAVNFAFTYPYYTLDFFVEESILSAVIMLVVAVSTSTLNSRIRDQENLRAESEKERMRGNLLRAISHDLRTPLTVILGHLQLLQKENLESSQAQRVKVIFSKAEKMKELVETFYDLSILAEQQTVPEKEKFNISNMLINLITENAVALEKENILPEINLPDYSIYVYSDKNMVERILQNLLTNAIKYSVGTIKITLMEKENNNIIFTIENPMSDSSEIDCNRLFDRFYTGDKSRHNGSTGLGLAVVKTLVAILGGNIVAKVHANSLIITLEL